MSFEEETKKPKKNNCIDLFEDIIQIGEVTSLTSYKSGDIIYLEDKIIDIYLCEKDNQEYTLLILDGFRAPTFQLCFKGDKTEEYQKGEINTILVHVGEYNIEGEEVIWLEEWYNSYMLEGYFTDLR